MPDPIRTFREESVEHLETLEQALLELEDQPENIDQINLAFRAMHTIKGASGMVGFDHLSYFTHHLESFFDRARNGEFILDEKMTGLILEIKDHIQLLLDFQTPGNELMAISESLLSRLSQLAPPAQQAPSTETSTSQPVRPIAPSKSQLGCWRLEIRPHSDTFKEGFDCLPLLRELASLGELNVFTRMHDIPPESAFDAESCYLEYLVLLYGDTSEQALEDVFIFVADDWQVVIEQVDLKEPNRFGDLVVEKGWLTSIQVEQLMGHQPKMGELLAKSGELRPEQVNEVLSEQKFIRKQQHQVSSEEQTVKVPSGKLDILMNLIGELVIVQARLNEIARGHEDERLNSLAEELSHLGTELRDTAFDIRMLPIGSTFGRFRRLVRDLSRELNKPVTLETEGAETELDKMVLDRLADPLVHLLRNSMDHGIEAPEQRRTAGKPEKGVIRLTASHVDGQIQLTISDDGAGLDHERILAKARERGLLNANDNLDAQAIAQLIFEPGFSTAAKVSDVSGRGVGMDVVKTSIEALQGRVTINSERGKGTTVFIYLPMTLAIIEGLMVRVNQERYVLPLSIVEECIETSAQELTREDGARLVENRGQLIPCVRLRESFVVAGEQPAIEQTVITRIGSERMGITVDEVIGQYQTVIKSLTRLYQHVPGLMGATILGNGDVAMILDVSKLIEEVKP